ncbi:MAG TPA: hypothetical protein VNF29_11805 [Candidatus Binataceae bacterium]|nr:hypothetical protein [Candidatus Binataceae bacterium]
MKPTTKLHAVSTACMIALLIALAPQAARAQTDTAAKAHPALVAAAQKIFKAFADDDADTVKAMVVKKYAKKVTKEQLRPTQTGPKLTIAYDSNVKVLRATDKDAVVSATMFTPVSSDVPKREATRLTIYMVKKKGQWLADAADKKQAADDATMLGGWYHPGALTYCPNTGLEYLGSHFSNKLNCRATAVCR